VYFCELCSWVECREQIINLSNSKNQEYLQYLPQEVIQSAEVQDAAKATMIA
jgi:hypothetical protein